jgi:hypothetical protein
LKVVRNFLHSATALKVSQSLHLCISQGKMVSKGLLRAVTLLAAVAPAGAFAPSSFGVKKV